MALSSSGRPKRRSRKVVDYRETEADTSYNLEKYLERVRKELEPRSDCLKPVKPNVMFFCGGRSPAHELYAVLINVVVI